MCAEILDVPQQESSYINPQQVLRSAIFSDLFKENSCRKYDNKSNRIECF